MTRTTTKTPEFHVGDKVWVTQFASRTVGTVIEDRGPLGVGGRRLYHVDVPNDPYKSEVFLLAEDELEAASEVSYLDRPDDDAIIEFLVEWGLVAILLRNARQPVWLRRDPFGNVTFTFNEGYSRTGGHVPPAYVLHGERIFRPKVPEVVEFVKGFGLSETQARDVVKRVGTSQ